MVAAIRGGRSGTPMPAAPQLDAAQARNIVAYLRTVPPVVNKVPAPRRTFLPVFLWGKFKMLTLGDDPPMVFYPGNVGVKGGPR